MLEAASVRWSAARASATASRARRRPFAKQNSLALGDISMWLHSAKSNGAGLYHVLLGNQEFEKPFRGT